MPVLLSDLLLTGNGKKYNGGPNAELFIMQRQRTPDINPPIR
jgi:hypothetical protein